MSTIDVKIFYVLKFMIIGAWGFWLSSRSCTRLGQKAKIKLLITTLVCCPQFGSKLSDFPRGMGFVLPPAPKIGELRSRLIKFNNFIRLLHKKGFLDFLSLCETI